ncbi:uncharacterized protein At1g65710-like [Diospyros lotus]|uniref:uncharacterized protein At1g65710-like n=1 Tax=Diospyros lotus TaxID=55363 RepID=UPI00225B3D9B|nr:uncharacterized protein At1g65710-like [Diospyros lotus]
MGCCLSKKTTICSTTNELPEKIPTQEPDKKTAEEATVKKEIFIIKHRKSHDVDPNSNSEEEKPKSHPKPDSESEAASDVAKSTVNGATENLINGGAAVVRTSSCTKEEVEAILIQCGRLSRSSSTGKADLGSTQRGRKYSGSKRSYDFDNETSNSEGKEKRKGRDYTDDGNYGDVDDGGDDRIHRHRHRHRQSRASPDRRRTPSREREQQQRSGSRERVGSGGGRRVSRSPGRRSESPITGAATSSGNANVSSTSRPGKMVSVPATVSSLAMDKSNIGSGADASSAAAIKRISVKRNAGDQALVSRTAASPRSRSPARGNGRVAGEQPLSLSRSNSRKAEQSPYRRNPLVEIDQNCIGFEATLPRNKPASNVASQGPVQKPNSENAKISKTTDYRTSNGEQAMANNVVAVTVVSSGAESLKPQTITRSRSSRLSRDLDINPDALLLNPAPSSYTALLLEDIQNFHQKSAPAPAVSLPACLSKAASILEAVADLNSGTSSNLTCKYTTAEQLNKKEDNFSSLVGRKRSEGKEPLVESEVLVSNDLMEPSFHKYVTMRRGTVGSEDMEEQESSGSNSFVGGQQHWVSSSSWEPNSADSTDRWTSNTRESEKSPLGFEGHVGAGRGRVNSGRDLHPTPTAAAASS